MRAVLARSNDGEEPKISMENCSLADENGRVAMSCVAALKHQASERQLCFATTMLFDADFT